MQSDLRALETEVTSALQGLSCIQTQAAPRDRPGKWTIQEVIEHLLQTYRSSIPAIQARVDKRAPTRATPTFRQRLAQFRITTLGQFPSARAPASVMPPVPISVRSGAELAARLTAELTRLDAVTRDGERLFGTSRAVSHIVLGPLSMQQWRRFHLVHGRHHLRQIRAICRDYGY